MQLFVNLKRIIFMDLRSAILQGIGITLQWTILTVIVLAFPQIPIRENAYRAQ